MVPALDEVLVLDDRAGALTAKQLGMLPITRILLVMGALRKAQSVGQDLSLIHI